MANPKKKTIKWEPTAMNKHPDTIISSDYPNWKHFIPSYERQEPRPDMAYLMGMEYARIWKKERDLFVPEVEKQEKTLLPRKQVIRGLNKKKQDIKEGDKKPFKMKKFENVPSKVAENTSKKR